MTKEHDLCNNLRAVVVVVTADDAITVLDNEISNGKFDAFVVGKTDDVLPINDDSYIHVKFYAIKIYPVLYLMQMLLTAGYFQMRMSKQLRKIKLNTKNSHILSLIPLPVCLMIYYRRETNLILVIPLYVRTNMEDYLLML